MHGFVANKIIEKKLSVRQTENFVKIFKTKKIVLKLIKMPNMKKFRKIYFRKNWSYMFLLKIIKEIKELLLFLIKN